MRSLEVLTPQPNFPNEDLNEANLPHVEYHLSHIHAEQTYAESLRTSLHMLHFTGHQALQICGVEVDYSEKEYNAFCDGFAAFEYISMLVNAKVHDGTIAVANVKELLIDSGELVEFEIANHYKAWLDTHPNTHGVITEIGAYRGETMKQLHARAIGAQIACDLQMAA